MNVHNFQNEGVIAVSVETTSAIPNIDQMKQRARVVATPFGYRAVYNRIAHAVDKALASTSVAYEFAPGSYTAQAVSDVAAVRTLLGWVNDLRGGEQ